MSGNAASAASASKLRPKNVSTSEPAKATSEDQFNREATEKPMPKRPPERTLSNVYQKLGQSEEEYNTRAQEYYARVKANKTW
jgi:hypothetical protein